MNKTFVLSLLLALTVAQAALAQTLVPATSEDLAEFDRRVSRMKTGTKAVDKAAFGAEVSEEAKKLKDAQADERKDFGKWVSGQKKKASEGRPSGEGSFGVGSANSGSKRIQPAPADKSKGGGKGNKKN